MSLLKSILDTSSTDYTGDTAHLHLPPPPSAPNRPGTSRGRYADDGQLGDASESRGISNITIRARGGHMMDDDAKVGRRFASEDDLSSRLVFRFAFIINASCKYFCTAILHLKIYDVGTSLRTECMLSRLQHNIQCYNVTMLLI